MKLSAKDFTEKAKCPKKTKEFIASMESADDEQLVRLIQHEKTLTWNGINQDLYYWINILNRFRDIMDSFIEKYQLKEKFPEMKVVEEKEELLLSSILDYTTILLEHCINKNIYKNSEVICTLLGTTSLTVRISALRLICTLLERFDFSPVQAIVENPVFALLVPKFSKILPSIKVKKLKKDKKSGKKDKLQTNSSSLNHEKHGSNEEVHQTSLHEILSPKFNVPDRYKSIEFKYYGVRKGASETLYSAQSHHLHNSLSRSSPDPVSLSQQSLNNQSPKKKQVKTVRESLNVFCLSEESIKNLSLQQLFDKASNDIPQEKFSEFVLEALIAKAFSGKSEQQVRLREQLVTFKCFSLACIIGVSPSHEIADTILNDEPYIFSYMTDLINLDNKVAAEPCLAALRVLTAYASKKGAAGDVVRVLGGNLSHGLLFHILRYMLKVCKADQIEGNFIPLYLTHLQSLISTFIDTHSMSQHLRNIGLLDIYLEFLKMRTNFRLTRIYSLNFIKLFIRSLPETVGDFMEAQGFSIIIDLLGYEVDFAIENPDYDGGCIDTEAFTYQITTRQITTIEALLKLVAYLVKRFHDMRNLYDSPILHSFSKILRNPHIFGKGVLNETLIIIGAILNNEPTAYPILEESGLIDTFIDCFASFTQFPGEILMTLNDTIGAVSLNKEARFRVVQNNIIEKYIMAFSNKENSFYILQSPKVFSFLTALEKLGRHHPELEPHIIDAAIVLFEKAPMCLELPPLTFYESPSGQNFYDNKEEDANLYSESGDKLVRGSDIKELTVMEFATSFLFLYTKRPKIPDQIVSKLYIDKCIAYIDQESLPFDFSLSPTVENLATIFKVAVTHQDTKEDSDIANSSIDIASKNNNVMQYVADYLRSLLDELDVDFETYGTGDENFDKPYIQRVLGGDLQNCSKFLRTLSKLNCLMFLLYHSFAVDAGVQDNVTADAIVRTFGKEENFDLIKKLLKLNSFLKLEELLLHENIPNEAMKHITKDTVRYQCLLVASRESNDKWDGTTAKFKNSVMLWSQIAFTRFWTKQFIAELTHMPNSSMRTVSIGGVFFGYKIAEEVIKYTIAELSRYKNAKNQMVKEMLPMLALADLKTLVFESSLKCVITGLIMFLNDGYLVLKELFLTHLRSLFNLPTDELNDLKPNHGILVKPNWFAFQFVKYCFEIFLPVGESSYTAPKRTLFFSGDDFPYNDMSVLISSVSYHELVFSMGVMSSVIEDKIIRDAISNESTFPKLLFESLFFHFKRYFVVFNKVYGADKAEVEPEMRKLPAVTYKNIYPHFETYDYYINKLNVSDLAYESIIEYFESENSNNFFDKTVILEMMDQTTDDQLSKRLGAVVSKMDFSTFSPPVIDEAIDLRPCAQLGGGSNDFVSLVKESVPQLMGFAISVVQLSPESAVIIGDTMRDLVDYKWYAGEFELENSLVVTGCSFNLDELDSEILSNFLYFVSVLKDKNFPISGSIEFILEHIAADLTAEHVEKPWFPGVLYAMTRHWPRSDVAWISETNLLETILSVKSIKSAKLVDSISLFLWNVATDTSNIKRICDSGILKELIVATNTFTYQTMGFQKSLISLLRRCMESASVIKSYMEFIIQNSLKPTKKHAHTNQLFNFIRGVVPIIERDRGLFMETMKDLVLYDEVPSMLSLLTEEHKNILKSRETLKEDSSKDDVSMMDVDDGDADENRLFDSGIISTLISELMNVSKQDLFYHESDDPKAVQKDLIFNSSQLMKNQNFNYALFLLQALTELLSSYKSAKAEFLTFSKKRESSYDAPKTRSTSLNFMIHQLLPSKPTGKETSLSYERCHLVTLLTRHCMFALLCSVPLKDIDFTDVSIQDPDLAFLRKYATDIFIKAIKDIDSSELPALKRYSKIAHIISLFKDLTAPSDDSPFERLIEPQYMKHDAYHFSRELMDKNFIPLILKIVAELDINFPESDKFFFEVSEVLTNLGNIKVNYQDQFKAIDAEGDDEEIGDDLDENDEAPDLLRNSTLAVYDIDDEDEDDDEEEDFLNRDIEFVYSEDEEEDIDDVHDDDISSDSMAEDYEMDEDDHDHPDIEIIEEYDEDEEDDNSEMNTSSLDEDMYGYDSDDGSVLDISDGESDGYSNSEYSTEDEIRMGHIDLYDESDGESVSNSFEDDESIEIIDADLEGVDLHRRDRDTRHTHFPAAYSSEDDEDVDEHDYEDEDNEVFHNDEIEEYEMNGRNIYRVRGVNSGLVDSVIELAPRRGSHGMQAGNYSFRNFLIDSVMDGFAAPGGLDSFYSNRFIQTRSRADQPVPNLSLKATISRWIEMYRLINGKTLLVDPSYMRTTSNEIISVLQEHSKYIRIELDKLKEKKRLEKKAKKEELEKKKEFEEASESKEAAASVQEVQTSNTMGSVQSREPVYVEIDGEPVDISGTDIDPEFLESLPEDMREDVFAQHVRERRAEAQRTGDTIAENTDEFLNSLPSRLRSRIVEQEYHDRMHNRGVASVSDSDADSVLDSDSELDSDEEEDDLDIEQNLFGNNEAHIPKGSKDKKQKDKRNNLHFAAMADKAGVASMMKIVFVSFPIHKRASLLAALEYFCLNKQTRSELIGFLLYILQEGIRDENSLKILYNQICFVARGGGNAETENNTMGGTQEPKFDVANDNKFSFPPETTLLSVATQTLEVLQHLLDSVTRVRFHFITDQENNSLIKKLSKRDKDRSNETTAKYPINILFRLLSNKFIRDDGNLMDLLTRSLQVATNPIKAIDQHIEQMKKEESSLSSKLPPLPVISEKKLKAVVHILGVDDMAGRVFQQTMSTVQNLSVLPNAKKLFSTELSKKASWFSKLIVKDLKKLTASLKKTESDTEEIKELDNFSSPSSNQAKLLRVLTALDYLYHQKQDQNNVEEVQALLNLYKSASLGSLWAALSDCLSLLKDRPHLNHVSAALSPAIESLMVVCKYSTVSLSQPKDILSYEERTIDFSKEPLENLFVSFTEEHKKTLNAMVKTNPKLLSGSFEVLIKNPKVLDFDNKRIYFSTKLQVDESEVKKFQVKVRRDQVFLDSFRALFFKKPSELRTAKLEVEFKGEAGVDAGGVTREWYQVLSRQMFNPDYGLFIPANTDMTTFHPNRASYINPEHLSYFKFVGTIIGKAVHDGGLLDCHFSRAVYKCFLGLSVSLKDMESLDLDYYKSLLWILENDITDIITEDFSVESDDFGEHKIIDLIPNGRDIAVTEENKRDYVRRIVEYKLLQSIKDQMDNLLEGFHSIIPAELIKIFDEKELELLISGLPDIDIDDWKNNTVYVGYNASSPQIQWFWRAVQSFDLEERAKLLQFATGTSKVPLNGFKDLIGSNGAAKFNIHRVYGATDKLPSSHTCFNQIDLPDYESYEKLRNALSISVREGHEGFGFA